MSSICGKPKWHWPMTICGFVLSFSWNCVRLFIFSSKACAVKMDCRQKLCYLSRIVRHSPKESQEAWQSRKNWSRATVNLFRCTAIGSWVSKSFRESSVLDAKTHSHRHHSPSVGNVFQCSMCCRTFDVFPLNVIDMGHVLLSSDMDSFSFIHIKNKG